MSNPQRNLAAIIELPKPSRVSIKKSLSLIVEGSTIKLLRNNISFVNTLSNSISIKNSMKAEIQTLLKDTFNDLNTKGDIEKLIGCLVNPNMESRMKQLMKLEEEESTSSINTPIKLQQQRQETNKPKEQKAPKKPYPLKRVNIGQFGGSFGEIVTGIRDWMMYINTGSQSLYNRIATTLKPNVKKFSELTNKVFTKLGIFSGVITCLLHSILCGINSVPEKFLFKIVNNKVSNKKEAILKVIGGIMYLPHTLIVSTLICDVPYNIVKLLIEDESTQPTPSPLYMRMMFCVSVMFSPFIQGGDNDERKSDILQKRYSYLYKHKFAYKNFTNLNLYDYFGIEIGNEDMLYRKFNEEQHVIGRRPLQVPPSSTIFSDLGLARSFQRSETRNSREMNNSSQFTPNPLYIPDSHISINESNDDNCMICMSSCKYHEDDDLAGTLLPPQNQCKVFCINNHMFHQECIVKNLVSNIGNIRLTSRNINSITLNDVNNARLPCPICRQNISASTILDGFDTIRLQTIIDENNRTHRIDVLRLLHQDGIYAQALTNQDNTRTLQ